MVCWAGFPFAVLGRLSFLQVGSLAASVPEFHLPVWLWQHPRRLPAVVFPRRLVVFCQPGPGILVLGDIALLGSLRPCRQLASRGIETRAHQHRPGQKKVAYNNVLRGKGQDY